MTFGNDIFYYTVKIIITIFGTLGMMLSCTKIRCSSKKAAVILIIYYLYVVALSYFILNIFGYLMLLRLCIFFIVIPVIIILYYLSEYSPWQAVFSYTMQVSAAIILAVTQTLLTTFFNGGRAMDFAIRVTTYLLAIALEFKFIRIKFIQLNYLTNKGWFLLSFVPIGFTVLLALIATYPGHYLEDASRILYLYVITFIMALVYCILFQSLISSYNLQQSEYTNKLLTAQARSIQKHFDTIFSTEEHIKILRHDMRFHMTCISEMLKAGNIEKTIEFINGIEQKLSEYKYTAYCSNKTVNAVLSYYSQMAEKNKINIKIDFFTPDNIALDIIDFTSMLSNAFDNAMNACLEIRDPAERFIHITAKMKNQYIIEIANTYTGIVKFDNKGLPLTDKKGHGIGTQSIATFAEKNGLILDYDIKDNWFKLRIVITI